MKQMIKRLLATGFAIAAMIGCFQGTALNTYAHKPVSETETMMVTQSFQPNQEIFPDNEELFTGYVENLFYENSENVSTFSNVAGRVLNTKEKQFFNELKGHISDIADGKKSSTSIVLDVEFTWTAEELGVKKVTYDNYAELVSQKYNEDLDYDKIWSSLLMDCPYEMYWYDKTVSADGFYYVSIAGDGSSMTAFDIHVSLPVALEYQDSKAEEPIYSFNTELAKRALLAKNNAKKIVEANKGLSDYRKMLAYKDAICEMTSYNDEAADNIDTTPYGNPWQLIWVFDGDEETKVVCEGYAKSFQYLCDLSGLTCYSVTGDLSWGIGAGSHMWNIVTLDDNNYLVDVTNCDGGDAGYSDQLFLVGTTGSVTEGYTFSVGYDVHFKYDETEIALLGEEILTLAASNYTIKTPEPETTPVTEAFSDISEGAWYIDSVQYVYDNGIMSGNNGMFNPEGNVTRAQVVSTLYRLAGAPAVTDYSAVEDLVDVQAGEWYTDAVCWAYSVGVANGNSSTKMFNMSNPVTRQQLATFFYNYADFKGFDTTTRGDYSGLAGADQVASYAADTMKWAYGMGLITGSKTVNASGAIVYDLKPTGTATRVQLASILQRFCEKNNL